MTPAGHALTLVERCETKHTNHIPASHGTRQSWRIAVAAAELAGVRPNGLVWGGGVGGRAAGAGRDEVETGALNTRVEEDAIEKWASGMRDYHCAATKGAMADATGLPKPDGMWWRRGWQTLGMDGRSRLSSGQLHAGTSNGFAGSLEWD
jgi:hypothetical protein